MHKVISGTNMPFTRDQVVDLKVIIKETISELFSDGKYISAVSDKVEQKLRLKEEREKVSELQKQVKTLKEENMKLLEDVEYLQQHKKRKSIRIYGLLENAEENLQDEVINLFSNKMQTNISTSEIEKCFRIGRNDGRKRPVLVTVSQENLKFNLLHNRKMLKGTGITISEDMTPGKYVLFKAAVEKLGRSRVWYYGGDIRVKVGDNKQLIKTEDDINRLCIE